MLKTKVTSIGKHASSKDDGLIIMFNDTASDKLRDVSLIHELVPAFKQKYDLAAGEKVSFDSQEYDITYVGPLVKSNLLSIGHVIFDFHNIPEHPRANTIYLKPAGDPDVNVGTIVRFGIK